MSNLRLWIIRHAKSSWADAGQDDYDRGLNARGLRNGKLMSRWLSEQKQPPTWLWTSSAARAEATASFVAEGFALPAQQLAATQDLYHASPEAIVSLLRQTPAPHTNVAVVAHNPGLTQLTNLLVGKAVTHNLPTFGVVELALPTAWGGDWLNMALPTNQRARQPDSRGNPTPHHAQLLQLQTPKRLAQQADNY